MKNKEFTIIKDTREQTGWNFKSEPKKPGRFRCEGMVVEGLSTADYSIKGYEDQILIERKSGFQELMGNFTPKENKERFANEMERMRNVPYKYLIIESFITDDLLPLTLPQFYKGPPISAIVDWIIDLQQEYSIVPIFAGSCGQKIARKVFEQFLKRHG